MKAGQFRELTREELEQKLSDLKDDLFKLRLRHSVAKLENPMKIRETKKDIARLETVIKEHQLKRNEGEVLREGGQMEAKK
jgi:large subunit ribosomal protein L29